MQSASVMDLFVASKNPRADLHCLDRKAGQFSIVELQFIKQDGYLTSASSYF
jgi:hypothetical protein